MRRILQTIAALLLGGLVASVVGFFALLYASQGEIIFPGPSFGEDEVRRRAALAGATLFPLETADGQTLLGWHEDRGGSRALVYFHGNASTCDRGDEHRALLAELELDYWCIAYRGYPGSSGEASEQGLREDARALWKHVLATGVSPEHVALHGRSLGGGVAVGLAAEVDAAGLIIESSFRSVRLLAGRDYPLPIVDLLLRHPFDSEALVAGIDEPTLVLHGDLDETIPVDHGRWLASHLARATYVEVPGHGHNSGLLLRDATANGAYRDALAGWLPQAAPPPVENPEE
ncbi:MAG: alpha/beta hydrolase [Deltaproteobacteria bacterium]|nr:MAG: alpha/beta hydrolase [Deltaproteobacteria bacterium]